MSLVLAAHTDDLSVVSVQQLSPVGSRLAANMKNRCLIVSNNFIAISLLISYETDSYNLQLFVLKLLNITTLTFDM
jgi:hypothetical protein